MSTAQPIPSASIDAILAARAAAVDAVEQIAEGIDRVQELRSQMSSVVDLRLDFADGRRDRFSRSAAIQRVDREIWSDLIHSLGLWSFMDAKARSEWCEQQDKGEFPPVTRETVEDAMRSLHDQRGPMVARGIQTLFERLSSGHKTNGAKSFGRKLIVGYVVESWGGGQWFNINHNRASMIDDLRRFLFILRGHPEPEHRNDSAYRRLSDATKAGGDFVAEFEWFGVKLHKSGTAHIRFHHQSDVDALNRMLSATSGGAQIPDERRR